MLLSPPNQEVKALRFWRLSAAFKSSQTQVLVHALELVFPFPRPEKSLGRGDAANPRKTQAAPGVTPLLSLGSAGTGLPPPSGGLDRRENF